MMECAKDPATMGARLAIYPMQENYAEAILSAVRATDRNGLAITTDDVSTCIQGPNERVWSYLEEVYIRAASAGGHVVGSLIISGG